MTVTVEQTEDIMQTIGAVVTITIRRYFHNVNFALVIWPDDHPIAIDTLGIISPQPDAAYEALLMAVSAMKAKAS